MASLFVFLTHHLPEMKVSLSSSGHMVVTLPREKQLFCLRLFTFVAELPGLQNTYFTFFEFATFFRFLSLDLRFFLKKRTVNRQTLNRS